MTKKKIAYPCVYVSAATHRKVAKLAKIEGKQMKQIGNDIVRAGLKAMYGIY